MDKLLARTKHKIGYALRFYRSALGLSQMDLAHNAGLSFRNYQRLENGDVLPRVDTIMRLAKELKIEPRTLLECSEEEPVGFRGDLSERELGILKDLKKQLTLNKKIHEIEAVLHPTSSASELHPFEIKGNRTWLAQKLREHLKLCDGELNIDDHLVGVKSVDLWESIARKRLAMVQMVSLLQVSGQLRFVESFHVILSWDPTQSWSVGLARECTSQIDLASWVQGIVKPSKLDPPSSL